MSSINVSQVRVYHSTGKGRDMLVASSGAVGLSDTQPSSASNVTFSGIPAALMVPGQSWSMDFDTIAVASFAVGNTLTFTTGAATGTGTILQIITDGTDAYVITGEITGTPPTSSSTVTNGTATANVNNPIRYIGEPSTDPAYVAWRVSNAGSDHIYIAFGSTPLATSRISTATTTARKMVLAGTTDYFGVRAFGDKVAIINV